MGPRNAVMGEDASAPWNLAETTPPVEDISRERNMAKFSRSAEFKALKETMLARIDFWKKYQPSGSGETVAFRDMPNEERGWRSLTSDYIIEELNSIIQAYETASEVVRDAEKAKRQQ